ncbi:MAG: serine--tRNA ligase [Paracoccaceae bacterium]|jgi:seryl-tRNA synthetase|nr:serine--tRNA ligase [Paracoccaceae bacterium]MDP7186821.1 serine--tRNA ligase [Paracoccaceae bacterium]
MHDIRAIRENPEAFDAAMARRGLSGVSSQVLRLDEERRAAILAAETAQSDQKKAAKDVGAAKAKGDEAEFERLRSLVAAKKDEVAAMQSEAKAKDEAVANLLMGLPNLPFKDIPDGDDEADNVQIRTWGEPRKLNFEAREHFEISGVQTGMDFEMAAKLSGSRFMVLNGAVARIHRALAQFMIDTHVDEHELEETWTPVLVREDMMIGTGQLPKFGEDSYQTTNGWWLVPTAEVPLTNMVNGETWPEEALPRRMVAHTQCFRSEAGSAGRDTAGVLRQHQFEKVEMVSITHPDKSEDEHARMTRCAEAILEKLGLPYRTVVLCTGDMGFGARRTHDIEVWLPGQNTYREISSVSTCGDFQARRMNGRFKPTDGGKPQFVHTLNGSGLAVGRALIAVLENGQQEDGSVELPQVLHSYLGGKTRLSSDGVLT